MSWCWCTCAFSRSSWVVLLVLVLRDALRQSLGTSAAHVAMPSLVVAPLDVETATLTLALDAVLELDVFDDVVALAVGVEVAGTDGHSHTASLVASLVSVCQVVHRILARLYRKPDPVAINLASSLHKYLCSEWRGY